MKTPEQLKGTIRSMAAKKNLRAQEVLQMFLFERILERMANSRFKDNFILKGGLLISSIITVLVSEFGRVPNTVIRVFTVSFTHWVNDTFFVSQ